jgi:hypothetical protein
VKRVFDVLDRSGDAFFVVLFAILVAIAVADRVLARRWSR